MPKIICYPIYKKDATYELYHTLRPLSIVKRKEYELSVSQLVVIVVNRRFSAHQLAEVDVQGLAFVQRANLACYFSICQK